LYKLW